LALQQYPFNSPKKYSPIKDITFFLLSKKDRLNTHKAQEFVSVFKRQNTNRLLAALTFYGIPKHTDGNN
jgi:hypothetical protein